MALTPLKVEQRLSNLPQQDVKVYNATPIAEAWTPQQIAAEMRRLHRTQPDLHVIRGGLNALVRSGLLREPKTNCFQRTPVRLVEEAQLPAIEEPMPADPTPVKPVKAAPVVAAPGSLVDRFGAMATDARARAGLLRAQALALDALADQLETAGVDVDEAIKEASTGNERLRQLRDLLNLGGPG